MKILNKKAMDPMILVTIIALLATFVVFLIIVFPPFKALIFGSGESGACQFSTLLSVMSKQITFGFGEIPAECKIERKTITADDIERYSTIAKRATKRYADQNLPAATAFPNSQYGWNEWALQRIIADDMVECFNKGWRGKLDLKATGWPTDLLDETGAYLCILCTRIKFDPNVKNVIHNPDDRRNIKTWLDWNNKEGKTYYSLLTTGVTPFFQSFVKNANFNINDQIAVTFISGVNKEVGEFTTSGVGGIGIFKYEDLTTNLGFKEYKVMDSRGVVMAAAAIPIFGPTLALGTWAGRELGIIPQNIKLSEAPARCAYIIGD